MARSRRQRAAEAIRSLPFAHGTKPTIGVEVFRLAELFDRGERDVLGHRLETPQRPEFHTIYVGLRGRGHLVVDFAPVPLGAGVLTFLAAGRVQQFVVDRSLDAWMLLVEPTLIAAGDASLRAPAVLSPAWVEPAIEIPRDEHRELVALVELVAAEQARPVDTQQQGILVALLHALLHRAERHASRDATAARPAMTALEPFFRALDRDCTTTRSVAHYARAAGLSRRRLGELLVAHTGKSTKQVVDERVILEQQRLLAFTELSVKELAARTGFDEPTNLVKFFRHHTGKTPQGFRSEQRATGAPRTNLPSARRS